MKCCYINLDQAAQRREDIEASFAMAARPGWRLERFCALDAASMKERSVEGSTTWAEKACFMSHKAVIEAHSGKAEHLLVLEDDVAFGAASFDIVDGFLQRNADADWDLLFLDISAVDINDMLTMYFNREKFMRQRMVIPLDLSKFRFFGTNSYIVNGRSFDKVLACLGSGMQIDTYYDIFLAERIRQGALKAAVLFPFVTTLSPNASVSQIQRSSMDTVNFARDIFRNMMWLESDPASLNKSLQQLEPMIAASRHAALAKVLTAICGDFDDPGFNSDAA